MILTKMMIQSETHPEVLLSRKNHWFILFKFTIQVIMPLFVIKMEKMFLFVKQVEYFSFL
jgi:hypothetical protein